MNEDTLALAVMDDDGWGCAITAPPGAALPAPTVWVSTSSHRSRDRLRQAVANPGPEYGIWPEGDWPRGAYYQVPAGTAVRLRQITGLRILRGEPSGGRLFKRWTSADMGGPVNDTKAGS